ncbi:fumarate reductase flavoprotein subunit [Fusarium langsethiae]|uniref:Fumarate reductase flavoprotein subunit n=1 Tax=Fusarium langsethiae TaxID=179993 RepID=A0A0M9EN71_FUSLA|nr:fumarate reductase flavoprotein subunit [Fusarium langsethiae]
MAQTGLRKHEKDDIYDVQLLVNGRACSLSASAVVLAAGGFESNPQMRSQFLGAGWDMAMVRGTPYNTGDVLNIAIEQLGAKAVGNWSGCHSVAWDANADPNTGNREASNEYTKSGYPLGLMLNVDGQRFVDEGVDLRNYTYAKFGRAILQQPEQLAFQSIQELADKCAQRGLRNTAAFVDTIQEYNEAVYAHRQENPDAKWDPAIRDNVSTQSSKKKLALAKSNWALPLDQGPYMAVKVTCGITFTFGGVKVDPQSAQLIHGLTGSPVQNVFVAGEMVGGLFYSNYPGGSGLTSGTVFGAKAGKAAAKAAAKRRELPSDASFSSRL